MRKAAFFLLAAAAAVLSVSCNKDEKPEPAVTDPEFKPLSETTFNVDKAGGSFEFLYDIVNPTEDMVIAELQEGVDWITEPDTRSTFGKVTFSVLANEEETTREASINLLYGTLSIELNVIQASYDYVTDCGFMSGIYYGTRYGVDGEHNYYTILSDMEYDGGAMPGGSYYAFDLYNASAPENQDNPLPAAGTYVLGEPGSTADMTFAPDNTEALRTSADGEDVFDVGFTEGTLTISYDDGVMLAEASLTDEKWR